MEKRGVSILKELVIGRNSSIRMSFPDRAGQKGCYRFLNNEKVTETALIKEMTGRCSKMVKGRHLLVIQDSSSFNLNNHYYRIKEESGIGTIEDNRSLGFFMHASLVMDAFSGHTLGFSDVQLWHRVYDDPDRANHIGVLPIEQKESFKWIRACENTRQLLTDASSITFVEDRDGDIYEQFVRVTNDQTHFVIRSCKERKLTGGKKLYSTIHKAKISGRYDILINGDVRNKRKSRKATICVRFRKVSLTKPERCLNKEMPNDFELYAIEAEEQRYKGKDKICWKLLTTHQVTNFEEAVQVIEIYRKRWQIEQLFRLLKKQGFGMEESQLEEGWAIRKLAVLALSATLRLMQLMYATEDEGSQAIDEVFTKAEQKCLTGVGNRVDGNTEKLSNPYSPGSLVWAKWIIARLGGWKGYRSQRIPGPITLKRGLDKFTQIFDGWCIALNLYQDVGTQ